MRCTDNLRYGRDERGKQQNRIQTTTKSGITIRDTMSTQEELSSTGQTKNKEKVNTKKKGKEKEKQGKEEKKKTKHAI
jgi:hypothetical protein